MYPGDAPSAFRIPISRVRSSTAVYMERQTTRNPIRTATPITTCVKASIYGTLFMLNKRDKVLDRIDLVGGKILLQSVLDGAVLAGLSSLT